MGRAMFLHKWFLITIVAHGAILSLAHVESFDFFYLVLQWPGAYCNTPTSKSCCRNPIIGGKPIEDFFLHGLWPSYEGGSYPYNCDPLKRFDSSKIQPIRPELNRYWASLACPSNNLKFWSHEWRKHGTCSEFDQTSYFKSALKLRQKLDLLAALKAGGIWPNNKTYRIGNVRMALRGRIGHMPGVSCNRDAYGNAQLYQIYVCVNVDGATLIDCPYPRSSCPSEVKFPAFPRFVKFH